MDVVWSRHTRIANAAASAFALFVLIRTAFAKTDAPGCIDWRNPCLKGPDAWVGFRLGPDNRSVFWIVCSAGLLRRLLETWLGTS